MSESIFAFNTGNSFSFHNFTRVLPVASIRVLQNVKAASQRSSSVMVGGGAERKSSVKCGSRPTHKRELALVTLSSNLSKKEVMLLGYFEWMSKVEGKSKCSKSAATLGFHGADDVHSSAPFTSIKKPRERRVRRTGKTDVGARNFYTVAA